MATLPAVHRRIQRYGWDLASEAYERLWTPVLARPVRRCVAMADLSIGERVLDVAAGSGAATFLAAAAVGPAGDVMATDISDRMVGAIARRACPNVLTQRADAEDLPFSDGEFDAALCVLGLMYPADPGQAIAEIHRVVRPGGRVAVCVWGRRERCGWNAVFPIIEARVSSGVCPMFFALGAPGALASAFRRAGFAVAQEERMTHDLAWPDADETCAAIFAGGPVALAYDRLDPPARAAVHRAFLASVAAYREGEGYRIPGEFVLLRAARP